MSNNPSQIILVSPHCEIQVYQVENEVLAQIWDLLQDSGVMKGGTNPNPRPEPECPAPTILHTVEPEVIRELPEITPEPEYQPSVVQAYQKPIESPKQPESPKQESTQDFAASLAALMAATS